MAVPVVASVRDGSRYRPPAVTGLVDLLDRQVRERPYARALVVTGERVQLSYRGLAALTDKVAARLGRTGLVRGDAVGLICANTVEFVVALLGAARAGLVVAPLDPALPASQLSVRLSALGARAVLVGPSVSDAVLPVPVWPLRVDVSRAGTATVTLDTGAVPEAAGAAGELSDRDALVLFTAGTTDRAKMVPLTHGNVAASLQGICATYELCPADATVAVMPFFHGHGLFAALLASLASGGCVLLPERGRFSAGTFWEDMRAVTATWFTAVPAIHEILLDRSEREHPGPQALPLKFVRSCSAPLNTATQRALERTFGAPLLSAYGMTESSHQATSEPLPQRGELKQGSVGRPTGVEVRVVDRGGRVCPVGVEGEVWVHGPTVARGYLADRDGTAYTFVGRVACAPGIWARWTRTGICRSPGGSRTSSTVAGRRSRPSMSRTSRRLSGGGRGCRVRRARRGVRAAGRRGRGGPRGRERGARRDPAATAGTGWPRSRCPTGSTWSRPCRTPRRAGWTGRRCGPGTRPEGRGQRTRGSAVGRGRAKKSSRDRPVAALTNARAATEPGVAAWIATETWAPASGSTRGSALVRPTTGMARSQVCGTMLAQPPPPTWA